MIELTNYKIQLNNNMLQILNFKMSQDIKKKSTEFFGAMVSSGKE